MARVYIYDSYDNKFFRYNLSENDPMPYSTGDPAGAGIPRLKTNQCAVDHHRCHGGMEPDTPYLRQRHSGGVRLQADLGRGGHGTTSQHYAGVAFDVGQRSTAAERRKDLPGRCSQRGSGACWPMSRADLGYTLTGGTASLPARAPRPVTPTLRRGSRSTYVLILQDALNALGYSTNTLDGIFGHATESALKACQRRFGLRADGVCGCATWKKIAGATVGIGRTATVIDK